MMTNLMLRGTAVGRLDGRQVRSVAFQGVELRAKQDGTGGSTLEFTGYASVYDKAYEMQDFAGPYTERIRPGAAKRTIADGCDTCFLLNHGGHSLARTKSGTMRLSEDSTGLLTNADLDPRDPVVQSIQVGMERGDLDEMSMGFWVTDQEWSPDFEQRDIVRLTLHKGDVSVVNYGANDATAGASLRGLDEHLAALSTDQRRELFDRLGAEFAPAPDEAIVDNLDLYRTRARLLAIA